MGARELHLHARVLRCLVNKVQAAWMHAVTRMWWSEESALLPSVLRLLFAPQSSTSLCSGQEIKAVCGGGHAVAMSC